MEKKKDLDMTLIRSKIDNFINGPSNYEDRSGRIWIKSLNQFQIDTKAAGVQMLDQNGLIVKSWGTITECANSLCITRAGVQKDFKIISNFYLKIKLLY